MEWMEISPEMDLESRIVLDANLNVPTSMDQSVDQLHVFRPSIWSRVRQIARENASKPHVEPPWRFAVHNFYDSALQLYYIEWFWRYYARRIGLRYKPVPFWYRIFNASKKPRGIKQIARAARDAKICELYRRGLSTWDIAKTMNLSPSAVYQIIRRACRD